MKFYLTIIKTCNKLKMMYNNPSYGEEPPQCEGCCTIECTESQINS